MPSPALDPLSRLVLLVFRAHQSLSADGDRLAAKWNLTSAKWKVLGAVALSEKPLSAAAIGRAMGLTRQAVIKQVHLLLAQGMLVQQPDPGDARAPLHAPTRQGKAAYDAIYAAWCERAATLTADLTPEQIDAASVTLETLLSELERRPLPAILEKP